jgi:uncharacterized membrane protein
MWESSRGYLQKFIYFVSYYISMSKKLETKRDIVRVGGKLREIVTVLDERGKVVHKIMNPLMIEFRPRDIMQIIVGATILAVPVAFTEETWKLGESLPLPNVISLALVSFIFISAFVYYNYYRNSMKKHYIEFIKRTFSVYFFSLTVVALILTTIQRAPWTTDLALAIKRMIIVAFPASMSAAVADMIK